MERIRERETERVRELSRERRSQRAVAQDRELTSIRSALEALTRESSSLRTSMAEAARATAGLEYFAPPVPAAAPVPPDARAETFRPLTPYLLGSNLVAGAQVIDVGPELGAYFGVEGGVLVVDVSPGTPAAIAGMRPGDVVVRLDRVGVRTVEDFRFGVAQAGDTLPITLVRQGSSLQVLLRRR
jgi:S1-C subfamily serine protease